MLTHNQARAERIVALLPQDSLQRVRMATPAPIQTALVPELCRSIASGACRLVLVDPILVRSDTMHQLLTDAKSFGVAVVVYCRLEARTLRLILDAPRIMPVEVVLRGPDDDIARLRAVLGTDSDLSVSALMLGHLTPHLNRMLPILAEAIVRLFGGGEIPASADQFAHTCHASPRTVHRRLQRESLTSVGDLLWCARIARFQQRMTDCGARLPVSAAPDGFAWRTWVSAYSRLVGMPPRRAIQELGAADLASRLVSSVLNTENGPGFSSTSVQNRPMLADFC